MKGVHGVCIPGVAIAEHGGKTRLQYPCQPEVTRGVSNLTATLVCPALAFASRSNVGMTWHGLALTLLRSCCASSSYICMNLRPHSSTHMREPVCKNKAPTFWHVRDISARVDGDFAFCRIRAKADGTNGHGCLRAHDVCKHASYTLLLARELAVSESANPSPSSCI